MHVGADDNYRSNEAGKDDRPGTSTTATAADGNATASGKPAVADADITRHASGHEHPPHGAGDYKGPLGPESTDHGDAQQAEKRLVAETPASDEHDPRQDGQTEKIAHHPPRQVPMAEGDVDPLDATTAAAVVMNSV